MSAISTTTQLPEAPHAQPAKALAEALGTDPDQGLTAAEAQRRQGAWGANALSSRGGKPAWLRFLSQFHDPLLYTLLLVGLVKVLTVDPREALVIWSVTLINAVIGYLQESKAETAIAALA
ncbi:MAG: cation-transporting P-type ATPase, partial [Prochlorococcaceae cyanobacterium]